MSDRKGSARMLIRNLRKRHQQKEAGKGSMEERDNSKTTYKIETIPKFAGWYWYRLNNSFPWECVNVFETGSGLRYESGWEDYQVDEGEWAFIEEPEVGNAES